MKTSELTGAALDWAVAKCEGYECQFDDEVSGPWLISQEGYLNDEKPLSSMRCSTNWAQGGPIIEREEICLKRQLPCYVGYEWNAWIWTKHLPKGGSSAGGSGPTPLIAAMRCYVASKLGDEVEVPEELQ